MLLYHHGIGRAMSEEQFSQYDFVITTYPFVESEYMAAPRSDCRYGRRSVENEKKSVPLHAVKWHRITLDEAHYIKCGHSTTTRTVLASLLQSCTLCYGSCK